MATSAKALFRATKRKPKPHADQATLIDAPQSRRPDDETRRPLDLYPTGQPEAIRSLLAADGARIRALGAVWEPAAGLGDLCREIEAAGLPCAASDVVDHGWPGTEVRSFYDYDRALAPAIINAFFGTAQPSDFSVSGDSVTWTGPASEWSFRRMVLHYAHLCAVAGGVDAFLIGSEMRGLTQVRSNASTYPAVTQLRNLATAVRTILGPGTKITRTTGQATAPMLLVQQTGGYMHNSALNLHQCKLDQLDFVRNNGGVLIGPLYPYKIDNSDGKGVHKTWAGYVSAYEAGAWAMAEVGAGRSWNLLPGTATRSGARITVPISVRGDESLTTVSGIYTDYGGDPANLGLEAVGGGTITAASVSGGNILVDVSGTVTAIRYAMQRSTIDYRTLTDANSEGYGAHRGLIRTTLTRTVTWGGMNFVVERWVPSFEVQIA